MKYGRKVDKIAYDSSKHYPNKDEAHTLRKIMSETGMSEEQVRSDIKYRRILADARKEGQKRKRTKIEKIYLHLIKEACRITNLAKEHPETIKVLDEIIKEKTISYFYRDIFITGIPKAKNIIKEYK